MRPGSALPVAAAPPRRSLRRREARPPAQGSTVVSSASLPPGPPDARGLRRLRVLPGSAKPRAHSTSNPESTEAAMHSDQIFSAQIGERRIPKVGRVLARSGVTRGPGV